MPTGTQSKLTVGAVQSFNFDDLEPNTTYRVRASFNQNFSDTNTLETLVRTPPDPFPPTFDLTGNFDFFSMDAGADGIGILSRDTNNVMYIRIYNAQGLLDSIIPILDNNGNPETYSSTARGGLGYANGWWYVTQDGPGSDAAVVKYSTDGSSRVVVVADTNVRLSSVYGLWVSEDESEVYVNRESVLGPGSDIPGLPSTGGLDRFEGLWYTAGGGDLDTTDVVTNARAVAFPLNPANTDPKGVAVLEGANRFLVLDATLQRVFSYDSSGTIIFTVPPPPEIAFLRVNGDYLDDVFGNVGPFEFDYTRDTVSINSRPHVFIEAGSFDSTDTVTISPSVPYSFPDASPPFTANKPPPRVGDRFSQTFTIVISDPLLGSSTYQVRVRCDVVAEYQTPITQLPPEPTLPDPDPPPEPPPEPEPEPEEPPIVSIQFSPTTILVDESSVLSWATTDADDVLVELDGVTISTEPSGSHVFIGEATGTYGANISATNSFGTTLDDVELTVDPAPPGPAKPIINTFTVDDLQVNEGTATTLRWMTTNATVQINGVNRPADGTRNITPQQTTTYTLVATATDPDYTGASPSQAITVAVIEDPPISPVINSLTATPTEGDPGDVITFNWFTTDATEVYRSIGSGSEVSVALDGSYSYTIPSQTPVGTEIFRIRAVSTDGLERIRTVVFGISETPPPPPPPTEPTVSLTLNPSTITRGQSSNLTWFTSDATTVSLQTGLGRAVPLTAFGSRLVSPEETTRYILRGAGPGGNARAVRTLTVQNPVPAPTATLTVSDGNIIEGDSTVLRWTTTDAVSGSISRVGSISPLGSGNVTVSPTSTTTYTLTVIGEDGSVVRDSVTVTVEDRPVISTFTTFDPEGLWANPTSSLVWRSNLTGNGRLILGGPDGFNVNTNDANGSRTISNIPTTNRTYGLFTAKIEYDGRTWSRRQRNIDWPRPHGTAVLTPGANPPRGWVLDYDLSNVRTIIIELNIELLPDWDQTISLDNIVTSGFQLKTAVQNATINDGTITFTGPNGTVVWNVPEITPAERGEFSF